MGDKMEEIFKSYKNKWKKAKKYQRDCNHKLVTSITN